MAFEIRSKNRLKGSCTTQRLNDSTTQRTKMNVLITGGAGYIGTSLVDKLNTNPLVNKVVVYDNMSQNNIRFFFGNINLHKVQFIHGDILNHIALKKALQDIDV